MGAAKTSEHNRLLFVRLIEHHIRFTLAKRRTELSKHDWYRATAMVVRDMLVERMLGTRAAFDRKDSKKLYYLSLEFLIGRSLENNLFNLGILDICREYLSENGMDLHPLFEEEPDAALGNGGLGGSRHAFSIRWRPWTCPATPTASITNSEFFASRFATATRSSSPMPGSAKLRRGWSRGPRSRARSRFMGGSNIAPIARGEYRQTWVDRRVLTGIPSDLPIAGYGGSTVNFVRLYSAAASNEFDMQIFNAGDYMKAVEQKMVSETISKVLYPSDAVAAGRELRLLQEYFFVACAIRDIVHGYLRRGEDFDDFPDKVAIQLNDTHPALTIAELMRLFVDEHEVPWDKAWEHHSRDRRVHQSHADAGGARTMAGGASWSAWSRVICKSFTKSIAASWIRRRRSGATIRKRCGAFRLSRRATSARCGWRISRWSAAIRSTAFRSCTRSC